MEFNFTPESFGLGKKQATVEIWVKDYYSLKWTNAKEAFYVSGSDVYGPMGHEFVPFASKAAAESFMSDHKGKEMYAFSEITAELVDKMRSGHKMKK
jgi:copper chaperone NosL